MKTDDSKTTYLLEAVLALKNLDEARRFFRDLLTSAEIEEFGTRWQAAKMLNAKISYNAIVKQTGLSTTTIARISKWLKRGRGGYKLMLKRQNHHNPKSFEKGLS